MSTCNQTISARILSALAIVAILAAGLAVRAVPGDAQTDAVVVIVSSASPMTEISRLLLADLYTGRASRFPNGTPAVPIDQRPGSPDRAAFSEDFLGRSEAQIKAHWAKIIFTGRGRPPAEASDGQAVRRMVARDPRAIGYLDSRLVDSTVRVVRVD
jgi:ABC-type phosphate transport system substrate-binding protein